MNRSRLGPWVLVAVAALAVVWLTAVRSSAGPPLDPTSTEPLGTRALTELIDVYAEVEVTTGSAPGAPPADTAVVVLLRDRLGDDARNQLSSWVQDGGTLVVTDPSSPLSAPFVGAASGQLTAERCTVAGLDGLRIEADQIGLAAAGGAETVCFGDGDAAFVVGRTRGAGQIVTLGSALPLNNEFLDEADNAVVAARVIVPAAGGRVAFWFTDYALSDGGAERPTLFGLIPTPVRWFLAQLGVAGLIGLVVAIRRFGRVVDEPQLVELPGSLGVRAEAELHRRAGGRDAAARKLQLQALTVARRALGLHPDEPAASVVARLQQHTSLDPARLQVLVQPAVNTSDADLRQMVLDVDAIITELRPTTLQPAGRNP